MISKAIIVTFLGPPGVGKSNQIEKLDGKLQRAGVSKCHIRTNNLLAYALSFFPAKIIAKGEMIEPISTLHMKRPELFRKLLKLWLLLDIISIYIRYLIQVKLPSAFGRIVLAEDLLIGTICDYVHIANAFDLNLKDFRWALKSLQKLIITTHGLYVVILDASKKTLAERWSSRGSFHIDKVYLNDPLDYITTFRRLPLVIVKALGLSYLYLNTEGKSASHVTNSILRWILSLEKKDG